MTHDHDHDHDGQPSTPDDGRIALVVRGMPWEWDLDGGNLNLFELPSVAFWTRPSLERLIGPLRGEVGDDLYRLLVAHYSSMGTKEDYQTMITELGSTFEEGFLAWGEAVSTAGWGRFHLPKFDLERSEAVVRVDNPWELQMQGEGEAWGCPFLQGKIIGIFTQAFGATCWAHEHNLRRDDQGCSIEFHVERSQRTIAVELDKLRVEQARKRDGELAREVERKTAALREAEERQRAVLSSLHDLVFTVDANLVVEHYLPPREHASSFPEVVTTLGRGVGESFGPSVAEALRLAIERGDQLEPGSHDFSFGGDGQLRRYEARFAPRRSGASDATLDGLTVVIRDVTSQRALEAQLRQSQKMESVGLLAGGVAHDFNNLLTAIMSAADLLALQVPEQLQELTDTVLDASETAAGLIQQLLDFSRQGLAVETAVDIHEVISTSVSLLQRSVDRRIHVVTELDAEAHHLRGDPNQLQSALLNLGVNARDAMPTGGVLRISTRNLTLDRDYCEAATTKLTPGLYVELTISDDGDGMSEATLARVFEPFFTTKSVGKGTGLGLAAVYGAVGEHLGEITVESTLGVGTTFHIRLPVDETLADSVAAAPVAVAAGRGCVLVVDDEPIVRAMGSQQLVKLGYEVLLADDGRSGVELFRAQRERIDLVILDIVMPIMNGHDAFRAMRAIDPEVRVLFASGFSRAGQVPEDIQGFVKKPYRLADLAEAVARAMSPASASPS